MKNWSKYITWTPDQVLYPETESSVQAIVIKAISERKKIRIIGSGHSFNPLWVTTDYLISLDRYKGIVQIDREKSQATVKAGTKLYELGELLFQHGMAMENLGDIDRQSIGGTIGTGTHGTGLKFGSISTQVVALKFVNGKGELITCSKSRNPALFKAAQLSLGTLGIITEITLQCVPAYKLELQNRKEELQDLLKTFKDRALANRNFEFYWFPYTEKVWTKSSNQVEDQPDKVGIINYLTEYVLENYLFGILCEAARLAPSQNKTIAQISAASITDVKKTYHSHKVYATPRLVRFNEMEYSVPLEAHEMVLTEIQKLFKKHQFNVHFPVENRVVKADDIYLSSAYNRDSAYIACHVYYKKPFRAYFKALETIFLDHDGRPHWGKMHFLKAQDLVDRYPEWATFAQHRNEQDPDNLFLNDYLETLFL